MPRRVNLPGADELFRAKAAQSGFDADQSEQEKTSNIRGTKRVRHDEKITVYLSSEELVAIEKLRLDLKAFHRIKVDRGRLMREAAAMMVEDFYAHAEQSGLVERLRKADSSDC